MYASLILLLEQWAWAGLFAMLFFTVGFTIGYVVRSHEVKQSRRERVPGPMARR